MSWYRIPFCLLIVLYFVSSSCKGPDDNYTYVQAYTSVDKSVDTVEVNKSALITIYGTMPNCCGAQLIVTELNSTINSRTFKVEGRYAGKEPHMTMPEGLSTPYSFVPTERGYFYIHLAQRGGTYLTDTFVVR